MENKHTAAFIIYRHQAPRVGSRATPFGILPYLTDYINFLNVIRRLTDHFVPFFFPFHAISKVGSLLTTDMSETCIRFGEFGARVMIDNHEVQHYATHVDPARREVSCWIASEEGKVRESLFAIDSCSFQQSRPFQLSG